MQKIKYARIIVFGLIVTALILGFFVYKKKNPDSFKQTAKQDNLNNKTDNLTDEQKLFFLPTPNATKAEIDAHSKLAAKLAVVGDTVEVTECKSNPIVLQVKVNSNVTMENKGQTDELITFDSKNVITLKAGKTLNATASFTHGPGLYGYRCSTDKANEIAGFILVAP